MSADTDMVERDYTEALTKLAMIAVDVISENEGVPTHLIAMAIACRIVEQYPDVNKLVTRAAFDASGIGEMVEAGRALAAKIDALADQQCGPFAIRNAVANSHEMDAFRAALSRARATVGNKK